MTVEWRLYRIADLGRFVGGATPSTSRPEYWDGGIPWTTSRLLGEPIVLTQGERFISKQGLEESSSTLVPEDNLLIGTRVGVGKVAVTGLPIAINQDITGVIVDRSRFDPAFVALYLRAPHMQHEFKRRARGTTIRGIPREDLGSIEISAPDPETQHQIAAVLSRAATTIEAEERLVSVTGELKRATMRQLFSHGLHREGQRETETGAIPESWEVARISDLMHLVTGGTPSRTVPEYWQGGSIPWVKTSEVDYSRILDTEEKLTPAGLRDSAAKVLPPETILVAMYGQGVTRGKVAVLGIPAATNQACVGLIAKSPKVNPLFVYYYLEHSYERLRGLAHGGQQQNLNKEIVASFSIPLPRPDEQGEIVGILEAIDLKLASHDARRLLLGTLFNTLLHGLMTGGLRVLAGKAMDS